jgi:hypothetical protein
MDSSFIHLTGEVNGVAYYQLLRYPPRVSRADPPRLRLDRAAISKLTFLNGNFVVMDPSGRWVRHDYLPHLINFGS